MSEIIIGNKVISKNTPCFIIAEAGVNHNGELSKAIELIDAAAETGASCVKFQTFKAENLVTQTAPKAEYQLKVTDHQESQFQMLKRLELQGEDYLKLIKHCKKRNIIFMSTPYNFEDVDFLDNLNVDAYKIASGQLVELPFLKYVAKKNKPIIMSTGMGYLSDVDKAIRTIKSTNNNQLAILHCVTDYPAKSSDSNLRAIQTLINSFSCITGYSDHTENNLSILGSIAMGAKIIEKHFTLSKDLPGPDHACSSTPEEMKQLISDIRELEIALGTGIKEPTHAEKRNSIGMRRSLVLNNDIKRGQIIKKENIGFKRPSTGLSINMFEQVIGKTVTKDLPKDTLLSYELIDWNN